MKLDKAIRICLLLVALTAIASLAVITYYIFREGVPLIARTGLRDFVFSGQWRPKEGQFGIGPMIVGSLAVTAGALVIGVIFGLGCAILLTQFCPPRVVSVIKPSIELLAGIPSVVFGFIGVVILVPLDRKAHV